jgi:hypothetical protein
MTSLNSDWEKDAYAFRMEHGPQEYRQYVELILRIDPGQSAGPKVMGEFDALSRLDRMGYPVPQVY